MSDTIQELVDSVLREVRRIERYGSRFYPCAVALTDDLKCEVIFNFEASEYVRFSQSGNMTLVGLEIALVPDSWQGPLVLIGAKP